MRYVALMDGNTVINVNTAEVTWVLPSGFREATPDVKVGWQWNGSSFFDPDSVPRPLTIADFERALDNHLDRVAKVKRYNDRFTCALRAGYPGPFQAEGQAFAAWMDSCNMVAYTQLQSVASGQTELPTTTQALIDQLPAPPWPMP